MFKQPNLDEIKVEVRLFTSAASLLRLKSKTMIDENVYK